MVFIPTCTVIGHCHTSRLSHSFGLVMLLGLIPLAPSSPAQAQCLAGMSGLSCASMLRSETGLGASDPPPGAMTLSGPGSLGFGNRFESERGAGAVVPSVPTSPPEMAFGPQGVQTTGSAAGASPVEAKLVAPGLVSASWTSEGCLLYTSPSPRDLSTSRMPSSA